jgi:peroxiredoxin
MRGGISMMKKNYLGNALVVLFTLLGLMFTCARGTKAETMTDDALSKYRGKILLVLMGMPGCSGTERATECLSRYAEKKPGDVEILRIDVPSPDGELPSLPKWDAPFKRLTDGDRKVAERLEFFFYPTFYILDREGEVRYSGECRPEEFEKMVTEIRAEKPGCAKHLYTPPLPKVGDVAQDFAAKTSEGKEVSLRAIGKGAAMFLFFGSTSCPFSMEGAGTLPELVSSFKGKNVAFAIVNQGPCDEKVKDLYREKAPHLMVIADEKGAIGAEKFGVRAVPFFFLLNEQGRIMERRPYTLDSARSALNSLRGIGSPDKAPKKPGAG